MFFRGIGVETAILSQKKTQSFASSCLELLLPEHAEESAACWCADAAISTGERFTFRCRLRSLDHTLLFSASVAEL